MGKKRTIKLLFILLCAMGTSVWAQEAKPIDAFVARVATTNTFEKIDNIWQPDNNLDRTDLLKMADDVMPLTISYSNVARLLGVKTTAINLTIPGANGTYFTLDLGRYDFLTNDFEVHTLGADNADSKFDYVPGLYYRGIVHGIPGSVASFSFFKDEVYGVFSIPGVGNYVVAPNTMAVNNYGSNEHYVIYNDKGLKTPKPGCTADQLPPLFRDALERTTTFPNNNVYNNCREVRVFEVADFAMYQTKGSNVTTVTNYLTALFNSKSTIYRNEGILITLKYVQVNTAADAYQTITAESSGRFLNKFGWVTQNTLHGCDLALLFSSRFNGGYGALGGVAWLKVLCNSYRTVDSSGPYGFINISNSSPASFPTYSQDVLVNTHEMGHILGSPHTHRCCWNPPARNTAIDGCYTIEGSCSRPAVPATTVGGTIMSYCHLTSSGINFVNGFGIQPGDTIRRYLRTRLVSTCGGTYNPVAAIAKTNKIIAANRECTDIVSGDTTTYYWQDNNTASQTDDTLVLIVKKHGNNIGTLDSVGFSVRTGTIAGYGTGRGDTIVFPAGVTGVAPKNYAMRRYWQITPTSEPASLVDVLFPFLAVDSVDVDGSVPGPAPVKSYRMYKVNAPIDPNPANNFAGAVASNFSIYNYASTASATQWSLSSIGSTRFANMKMKKLAGGGTGFFASGTVSVGAVPENAGSVTVFPNPATNQWLITVTEDAGSDYTLQLYAADGKIIKTMQLQNGVSASVDAKYLPVGIYYYRIISEANVYTGNLMKN